MHIKQWLYDCLRNELWKSYMGFSGRKQKNGDSQAAIQPISSLIFTPFMQLRHHGTRVKAGRKATQRQQGSEAKQMKACHLCWRWAWQQWETWDKDQGSYFLNESNRLTSSVCLLLKLVLAKKKSTQFSHKLNCTKTKMHTAKRS